MNDCLLGIVTPDTISGDSWPLIPQAARSERFPGGAILVRLSCQAELCFRMELRAQGGGRWWCARIVSTVPVVSRILLFSVHRFFWGGIAAWGKTQVGPILHPFGMKTEDFIPPTGICNPPPKKQNLERTLFRSAKDDTVLGPGLTPKTRRADAIPLRSVCSEPYSSHWHRCHQTQGLFVTSFYSSFADWHFAEKPRPSLLAGLAARIDGTNIVQALSCGCQPLQDLAWRRMAELSEPQLTALVEPWLQSDPASIERYAVTAVVLKGLAHETLAVSDAILARVVSLMESPSAEVRLAAATVVAARPRVSQEHQQPRSQG